MRQIKYLIIICVIFCIILICRWAMHRVYYAELCGAIAKSDINKVRACVSNHPSLLRSYHGPVGNTIVHDVVCGWFKVDDIFVFKFLDILPTKMVNVQSALGTTPLYDAVKAKRPDNIIKAIIDKGGDVNGAGRSGYVPLHAAINNNDYHMVELLLQNGANPNTNKSTALGLAIGQSRTNILTLMRSYVTQEKGVSPCNLAAPADAPVLVVPEPVK